MRGKTFRAKGLLPTFKDVSYGIDPLNTLDIYKSAGSAKQPAIIMVHGGAWITGDKANANIITNKVPKWTAQGVAFISVNYPFTAPITEATNVYAAINYILANTVKYGIDGKRLVIMGHSAGAHLITYLACKLENKWLGQVVLDSAALDLPYIMSGSHPSIYDTLFGVDTAYWELNSPKYQYSTPVKPMYIVASTEKAFSIPQSTAFAIQTGSQLYTTTMTHEELNRDLGLDSEYTTNVDNFMRSIGLY